MTDSRYTYTANPSEEEEDYGIVGLEYQVFIPEGFEGVPETVVEALQRTKALVQEEGRWLKSDWFKNHHPDVDPEDAFCNNWGVCMDGGLIAVTAGVKRAVYGDRGDADLKSRWDCDTGVGSDDGSGAYSPLVEPARTVLVNAGVELFPDFVERYVKGNYYDAEVVEGGVRFNGEVVEGGARFNGDVLPFEQFFGVPTFNDSAVQTRTEAIEWLDKAIELAEATNDG